MTCSFIIPSYNSAHTIARCLDSIYSLSLNECEFEIVFIDDCSTDNTCDIVAAYQTKHTNLILLKQPKNNRQGAARNRGVKIANGEYICFVDSDDAVREGVVEAIHTAKEMKTDLTAFHYGNANEQGVIIEEKEKLCFAKGQIFSGIDMQNTHPYWCSAPWGYIYSKHFLSESDYPFAEGVLYEDSDFVAAHLYYAKRMAYSHEIGYIAYYREGSTTHSNNYKNTADYFLLGVRMLTLYTTIQKEQKSLHCKTADGIQAFADSVLDGAINNITYSLKRLFKLRNMKEIKSFYKRIDSYVNRRVLYNDKRLYKFPKHWSQLAFISIRYKCLSIVLNTCLAFIYRAYCKLKH
ncbi:MAG: glycosyltransferase family 2 protein [Paludibacteraceae bacterium]|nr:glycosyltransferase family 2 protein [Paludibacteraceae bacterium]